MFLFVNHLCHIFQPGMHAKEINPYWKDGGTGLPEEKSEVKPVAMATGVGDAGLSWLKKSYERCVQQAKEEGRSLEELAAERWGVCAEFSFEENVAEDTSQRMIVLLIFISFLIQYIAGLNNSAYDIVTDFLTIVQ